MHTFNEKEWHSICEYEFQRVHVDIFAKTVCNQMIAKAISSRLELIEPAHREQALMLAKQWWSLIEKEIDKEDECDALDVRCGHGNDPRYCPVGCGDLEEYEYLDDPDYQRSIEQEKRRIRGQL